MGPEPREVIVHVYLDRLAMEEGRTPDWTIDDAVVAPAVGDWVCQPWGTPALYSVAAPRLIDYYEDARTGRPVAAVSVMVSPTGLTRSRPLARPKVGR